MATKAKNDAETLLRKSLGIFGKDLRNIEKWQRDNPGQPLDYKSVNAVAAVVAKLQTILEKEALEWREALKEASRLPVAELIKRAQGKEEDDGEAPEVLPDP